jgi:hypothetical protein
VLATLEARLEKLVRQLTFLNSAIMPPNRPHTSVIHWKVLLEKAA